MSRYFNRKGEAISSLEWSGLYESNEQRRVLHSTGNGVRVSTVWLGLDHNFDETGPPLIFETMVFRPELPRQRADDLEREDWRDIDSARYSTEDEARAGHAVMCAKYGVAP